MYKRQLEKQRRVILGEEQCKSSVGADLTFFTEVTAAEMRSLKLPPKAVSSSTMIMAFLEGAMKRYGAELNIDVDGLRACRPKTDTTEQIIARATADGQILQPVFISELAGIMKHYAMQASDPFAKAAAK